MPLDSLVGVRIEYLAPRKNGLGGGWFGSCSFAGRAWRFRFYGRDWTFGDEDAGAWKALTPEQGNCLRAAMLATLERAQLAQLRRRNRQGQVRSGLRTQTLLALRDTQRRPEPRPRPQARQPRTTRQKTTRRVARTESARGDPSPSSSLVADLATRLPREHGGAAWCVYCPGFWGQAESRAQAPWLVQEHLRQAHLGVVSR